MPSQKPINEKVLARIRAAREKHKSGAGKYLRIERDKPVTFYVLEGEYGDDQLFYKVQGIHYLGKKSRIFCPRVIDDGDCPICKIFFDLKEEESSLKNDLEELKKDKKGNADAIQETSDKLEQITEEAKKFSPSVKYAMNVVVKGEKKARIFTAPKGVFDSIFGSYASNAEEINVFDPMGAVAFTVEKKGKGITNTSYETSNTAYTKAIAVDEEGDPDEEAIQEILKSRYDLDEEIKASTDEEIEKALAAFLDGDAGESDEKEKPKKEKEEAPKKAKSESRKPKPEPEPDPDEENGEGEEEDKNEEPPAEEKSEKAAEEAPKVQKSSQSLQERLKGLRSKVGTKG